MRERQCISKIQYNCATKALNNINEESQGLPYMLTVNPLSARLTLNL